MGEYKVGAVVVIHTGGFMKYEVIQVQETGEEVVVYSGGIESCREWSDAKSDQYPESEFYVLQCDAEMAEDFEYSDDLPEYERRSGLQARKQGATAN